MGMQHVLATIISFSLFINVCWANDTLILKDNKDRISYSVGYQIGGDLTRQGLEINPEVVVRGIQDAIKGTGSAMTPSEMRTTLVELKTRLMADQKKKMEASAEKNLAEGKAFLAENAKKDGVKTLPSGLQYKVIEAGSGKMPEAGDNVTVHYRGTLIDGSEFDSSYSRGEPATFKSDRVIAGWTEALQLMKEGAKWQLFIPSELAYGQRGAGAQIGPNSTLIFDVELLSVQGK